MARPPDASSTKIGCSSRGGSGDGGVLVVDLKLNGLCTVDLLNVYLSRLPTSISTINLRESYCWDNFIGQFVSLDQLPRVFHQLTSLHYPDWTCQSGPGVYHAFWTGAIWTRCISPRFKAVKFIPTRLYPRGKDRSILPSQPTHYQFLKSQCIRSDAYGPGRDPEALLRRERRQYDRTVVTNDRNDE